ncbi:MAG: hypothetical protein IVW54_02430 [Candidatus Binataceae bacterium]|nr:hypothetical protein [Candidatus Binataceae bacterium]
MEKRFSWIVSALMNGFGLFTSDARYVVPSRQTRDDLGSELNKEGETGIIDEDLGFLKKRVLRLGTGLAHAEQPPSRTRRFITNVTMVRERTDEVDTVTNMLVFQSRYEHSENFLRRPTRGCAEAHR